MKEPKGTKVTKKDVDERDVAEVLEDKEYIIYITPRGRKWFAADGFGAEDLDVLKAECIRLKEDNRQLKESNVQTNNQLRVRDQELIDAKKTISKMQQHHDAEVQDLKDQLDEARADAAVAEKNHARAVGEKNDYADALDNDSIAFEEILSLAILMERGAKSMHEVSKMIQVKTEGRV